MAQRLFGLFHDEHRLVCGYTIVFYTLSANTGPVISSERNSRAPETLTFVWNKPCLLVDGGRDENS